MKKPFSSTERKKILKSGNNNVQQCCKYALTNFGGTSARIKLVPLFYLVQQHLGLILGREMAISVLC